MADSDDELAKRFRKALTLATDVGASFVAISKEDCNLAATRLAAHRARSGGEDVDELPDAETAAKILPKLLSYANPGNLKVGVHMAAQMFSEAADAIQAMDRHIAILRGKVSSTTSLRARLERMEKALGEIAADGIREPRRSDHDSDDAYWEACGAWRMTLKARAALARTQGGG